MIGLVDVWIFGLEHEGTRRLKLRQLTMLNYVDRNPADFEENQLVSLELGGAPRSRRNLWPQPWSQARRDDNGIDARLHRAVCNGTLTLLTAQAQEIAYKHASG